MSSEVASFCCDLLLCTMVERERLRPEGQVLTAPARAAERLQGTYEGREGRKEMRRGEHRFSRQEEDGDLSSPLAEEYRSRWNILSYCH